MPQVVVGFAVWSLATGLKCMLSRTTEMRDIIGFLVLEGVGIGFTLQPSKLSLHHLRIGVDVAHHPSTYRSASELEGGGQGGAHGTAELPSDRRWCFRPHE
jgi:hypothetical protein